MKTKVICLCFVYYILICSAATNKFPITTNQGNRVMIVWCTCSPRTEISPTFSIDIRAGKEKNPSLRIDSKSPEQFGFWQCRIDNIIPEQHYQFSAWYKTKSVQNDRRSVIARLEWLDKNGRSIRPPEYCLDVQKSGQWKKVEYIAQAPQKAVSLDIQLSLGFTKGTVWWDDISLVQVTNLTERICRVATVFLRPNNTKSSAKSVEEFCRLVETNNPGNLDFVCLPEGITVIGTGKSYYEVSEPIPGPTTELLGRLASKIHAYIIAGLYERHNHIVYNTAVLIDRNGKIVGTYRKTHLPREEWEKGITPGNEYPIFQTDICKIGIIICWDLQFPEPARTMAAKGAEIIFIPIWGGSETLAKARAIENSVFIVTSTYDMRSFIIDPTGRICAEATSSSPFISTEISLDKIYYQPWIGNMKTRVWKEWRPDIRW